MTCCCPLAHRGCRRGTPLPSAPQPRLQSDRERFRQAQGLAPQGSRANRRRSLARHRTYRRHLQPYRMRKLLRSRRVRCRLIGCRSRLPVGVERTRRGPTPPGSAAMGCEIIAETVDFLSRAKQAGEDENPSSSRTRRSRSDLDQPSGGDSLRIFHANPGRGRSEVLAKERPQLRHDLVHALRLVVPVIGRRPRHEEEVLLLGPRLADISWPSRNGPKAPGCRGGSSSRQSRARRAGRGAPRLRTARRG